MDRSRWAWAFVVACPACAGTLVFSIGTAVGVTALALKGAFLAALLVLLGALWARNAWRRRGEGRVEAPSRGLAR